MTLAMNLQNLQQENGTLLMTKIMGNMAGEIKMMQPLNLKQKSLNQIFVILRCIYCCDRTSESCRCCCKC